MAGPVIPLSEALAGRLQELLQRARNIKKSTSIEPPLQVSELVSDGEDVLPPISGDRDVHMNAIETAAKSIFYNKLVGPEPVPDPNEPNTT